MSPALAKDDLLAPIPGDNPSGPSLRYERVYDQIREARRSDPGGEGREPKEPDHAYIVEIASDALRSQTKDLQLAVWLTDSLVAEEAFGGLAKGLELTKGLLENFWDTVWPIIEDNDPYDRIALLEWLGNYYEALNSSPIRSSHLLHVTATAFTWDEYQDITQGKAKENAEALEKAFEATPKAFYKGRVADVNASLLRLKELEAFCDEKFGRDGPGFTKLRQLLEQILNSMQALLKRKLETDPDPVVVAPALETAVESAAGPTEPQSTTAVFEAFDGNVSGLQPASPAEANARVAAAAHYLRKQAPSSPAPYLLLRSLRWGELRAGGDEISPKLLTAPPTEARTRLRQLAAESRWAEVLDFAEQAMATECGRAWLDLQRYSIQACEQLGYGAVVKALKSELKCLLADYPALKTAILLDDTGAANPATTTWLEEFTR